MFVFSFDWNWLYFIIIHRRTLKPINKKKARSYCFKYNDPTSVNMN